MEKRNIQPIIAGSHASLFTTYVAIDKQTNTKTEHYKTSEDACEALMSILNLNNITEIEKYFSAKSITDAYNKGIMFIEYQGYKKTKSIVDIYQLLDNNFCYHTSISKIGNTFIPKWKKHITNKEKSIKLWKEVVADNLKFNETGIASQWRD